MRIGATTKRSVMQAHPYLRQHSPALVHAVAEISAPLLRNANIRLGGAGSFASPATGSEQLLGRQGS